MQNYLVLDGPLHGQVLSAAELMPGHDNRVAERDEIIRVMVANRRLRPTDAPATSKTSFAGTVEIQTTTTSCQAIHQSGQALPYNF